MRKIVLGLLVMSMFCGQLFAASNWFVNTELKQDFRYRWQEEKKEDARNTAGDKYTRYRERIRYRLGIETKANEEMTFAGRLATAGWNSNDSLSTNDSLGENNGFTKDSIILDQAYLNYMPMWLPGNYGQLKFTFGKFDVKDGLYTVTDIMWDTDISLEGKNINYNYNGIEGLNLFVNIGSYIVLEDAQYDDFILNTQQLGAKWTISPLYLLEIAASKFMRNRINSTDTTAMNLNEGKPINETMAKFNVDTMALGVPYIGRVSLLWDEYINTNENERNRGTSSGLEIGTPKLAVLGDWSLRGLNRKLEKNVGWTLGDSDMYGGGLGTVTGLNTKGTELILSLALAENATLGIDQYLIDVIDNDLGNDLGVQRLTQFDINVKF